MKRLFLLLAAVVLIPALASAQSSGSFTYGTGNAFTGTTGCVLMSNGSISGVQQVVLPAWSSPQFNRLNDATACYRMLPKQ